MGHIRIAGTVNDSVVDGPGLRYTVFFQGCSHHCPGCHNPQTWSFDGGKLVSIQDILDDIRDNPLLTGVTFSGGDPFDSAEDAMRLAVRIKDNFPALDIWMYTGYTYEALLKTEGFQKLLLMEFADVLVDGRFLATHKDLSLRFRGSGNQRIINIPASLKAGRVIPWTDDNEEKGVAV